jgi:hypothetical protein
MSVRNYDDRKHDNNTAIKHRQRREPNSGKTFSVLCRLLALLLAFSVGPTAAFAQEWDHLNGRDKAHDPTGLGS